MEASNALNMIDLRNTREAPLAVGTGKQRSTVQRMIALRSLLGWFILAWVYLGVEIWFIWVWKYSLFGVEIWFIWE